LFGLSPTSDPGRSSSRYSFPQLSSFTLYSNKQQHCQNQPLTASIFTVIPSTLLTALLTMQPCY